MPDPVITAEELAGLRDATESWFTDLCDIYGSGSGSADAYGGWGNNPESLRVSGVPCSIESGAEHVQTRALLAKIENTQAFTVTLPADTDVLVGDHLVITTQNSDRLRVEAVMAPESWEIERRVIATEFE